VSNSVSDLLGSCPEKNTEGGFLTSFENLGGCTFLLEGIFYSKRSAGIAGAVVVS